MDNLNTAPPRYRQRPKPIGFENSFVLEGGRLTVDSGRKVDRVALAAVESLRLTYEPRSFASSGFRTTLTLGDGRKLSFTNLDWTSMVNVERRDADYGRFVMALVAAIAAANPSVRFIGGRGLAGWLALAVVAAITVLGLAAFVLRAAATENASAAALLGLAFLGLTLWQLGPMIRRNRPRAFTARTVPPDLLP